MAGSARSRQTPTPDASRDATVALELQLEALKNMLEVQQGFIGTLVDVISARLGNLSPGAPPAESPIATARELIELAKEIAPEPVAPPSAQSWPAVAERLAAVLEKALERSTAKPSALPAPSANGPPAPVRVSIPPMFGPLIPLVPQLVQLAKQGGRPELQASAVADSLPSELVVSFRPMFQHDGFPLAIIKAFPPLREHTEWLVPFFYAMRGHLEGQGVPDGEPIDVTGGA